MGRSRVQRGKQVEARDEAGEKHKARDRPGGHSKVFGTSNTTLPFVMIQHTPIKKKKRRRI